MSPDKDIAVRLLGATEEAENVAHLRDLQAVVSRDLHLVTGALENIMTLDTVDMSCIETYTYWHEPERTLQACTELRSACPSKSADIPCRQVST